MHEKHDDSDNYEDMLEVSAPDFSAGSPLDLLIKYKKDPSQLSPEERALVEKRMEERRLIKAEKEKQRREKLKNSNSEKEQQRREKLKTSYTEEELEGFRKKFRDHGDTEEEIEYLIEMIVEG